MRSWLPDGHSKMTGVVYASRHLAGGEELLKGVLEKTSFGGQRRGGTQARGDLIASFGGHSQIGGS